MIELVFVIVVIGILSAIAIPKFAATRDDAIVSKGRATVGALRSAIATERQKRILKGDFSDISGSDAKGLLQYGLGKYWSLSGDTFTFSPPSGGSCSFKIVKNKLKSNSCTVNGMKDL